MLVQSATVTPLRAPTLLLAATLAWGGHLPGRAAGPIGVTLADGQCLPAPGPAQCLVDERGRRPEGRDAALHRRRARALRAPGALIEDPCADGISSCRPALSGAFGAFDRTAEGGRAGVVVFGNSLIAANRIINVLRLRLQEQLGDGGRGLLLADRLGVKGPRDRTADDATGWVPGTVADVQPRPEVGAAPAGVAGAVHVSVGPAISRFRLLGETEATILGVAGRRSPLEVRVDGGRFQVVLPVGSAPGSTGDDENDVTHRLLLPEGARRLELRAPRAGAAVHGVVLEHPHGGVVVDTLGVAAADAGRFLNVDAERFRRQLDARRPDLVVLMLGGNETKRIAWGHESHEDVEAHLRALIRRVDPGPDRGCLVVGPIDAVVGDLDLPEGGDPMRQRPELAAVNALHRRVAVDEGCAWFDLYAAMGGEGSLRRLRDADALHNDLVHPKELGLGVLGQLLADAILQEWRGAPLQVDRHADDGGERSEAPERGGPFAVTTTLDEGRTDRQSTPPAPRFSL